MSPDRLVRVVLAASASTRFGSARQLLPFGDTTLLGQAVRDANASTLRDRRDRLFGPDLRRERHR